MRTAIVVAFLLPFAASAQSISINSAVYGANCGASNKNNAGDLMKAQCDGKTDCQYTIDVKDIPDPAPGCSKDFNASYTCGGTEIKEVNSAPEASGKTVNLSCSTQR
jgi:hypothetical protein